MFESVSPIVSYITLFLFLYLCLCLCLFVLCIFFFSYLYRLDVQYGSIFRWLNNIFCERMIEGRRDIDRKCIWEIQTNNPSPAVKILNGTSRPTLPSQTKRERDRKERANTVKRSVTS